MAVLFRVGLCGLGSMVVRVLAMCPGRVGVMPGLLMAAGLVMLCRFLVVMSCCIFRGM
jgi:hypothetical protein